MAGNRQQRIMELGVALAQDGGHKDTMFTTFISHQGRFGLIPSIAVVHVPSVCDEVRQAT
jgi:hypothetical protein